MESARNLNCISPDVTWKEVSPLLEKASSELAVGEMIHGENFNLMEAMSSFEIMDPKVDVKFSSTELSSVEDYVSKGFTPIHLSIQQLIDVMDHLLACEATWHNGFSLSQTVFTCIYLLKPEIPNPNFLLSSYCKSVSSTCSSIRNFVCKSNANEEEDFVVQSFGLPLESSPAPKILSVLNFLEEEIMKTRRMIKSCGIKLKDMHSKSELEMLEGLYTCLLNRIKFRKIYFQIILNFEKKEGRGLETASKQIDEIFPLLSQLRTSETFLSSLPQKLSVDLNGTDMPEDVLSSLSFSPPTPPPISSSLYSDPTHVVMAANRNGNAANSIITPLYNVSIHEPVAEERKIVTRKNEFNEENGKEGGEEQREKQDALHFTTASRNHAFGFHSEVNRKLFAPVPQRKIRIFSWVEALVYFENLFQELQKICHLPLTSSLEVIQNFIVDFQKGRPLPLSRSIIQVVTFQGETIFGKESASSLLSKCFDFPPPFSAIVERDPFVQPFFKTAGLAMANVLKCSCQNSCRQRRNLNKMFPHFANLLSDAEKTFQSEALKKYIFENFSKSWWSENLFLSWTVEQSCRIVFHFLLLGFQNELYAQCEYIYVYWYLDHVLSTLLHNATAREKNCFERKFSPPASGSSKALPKPAAPASGSGGHGKRGKKKPASSSSSSSSSKSNPPQYQPSTELHYFNCHLYFCKAYVRMLLALQADKKWKSEKNEMKFNSLRERYNQRFESLKCLHIPEPLPYSFFLKSTNVDSASTSDLYASSQELFNIAGSYCTSFLSSLKRSSQGEAFLDSATFSGFSLDTRLQEIQSLQKIANRNILASRVADGVGHGKNLIVSFDFSLHYVFPIIMLKRCNA